MADIKHKPLEASDYRMILILAENNMRVTETSYELDVHRGTVLYRIEKIKKLTGLDPMNFYDLHELVKMANEKLRRKGRR